VVDSTEKSADSAYQSVSGKRSWERLEYQTSMELMLQGGRCISGHTMDVSLGGVFLSVTVSIEGLKIGDEGELFIHPRDDNLTFPCKIVRIAENGLGLNFNDKQAAFGMFVTHDMMLDLLSSINNDFAVSLNLEITLATSVSHIKNYLQSEAASLFLVDDDTGELVCRACSGPVDIKGTKIKQGEGVVGKTVSEGLTVVVQDVNVDSFFSKKVDEATGFVTESLMCAPLKVRDKTFGALEVINKRGSGFFAGHDRVVITALASATAMAIHNARQAAELVEKEAAEKASKTKSEFISSMSHELRTPLNAILGFAQILTSNPKNSLNKSDKDTANMIVKGGKHLLSLINDILDLSRIESGKITMDSKWFDPADVIENCVVITKNLAQERPLIFTDKVTGENFPELYADQMRIQQVLLNLLSNAVKYTPAEKNICFECAPTSDGMLRFIVTDEGPGITKEKQEYLFEPFNRLDMEHGATEGTGIGLTITKKLVELMHGRIGLESVDGSGCKFWVDIPTQPYSKD
jgi:signal transduction histidine kinase